MLLYTCKLAGSSFQLNTEGMSMGYQMSGAPVYLCSRIIKNTSNPVILVAQHYWKMLTISYLYTAMAPPRSRIPWQKHRHFRMAWVRAKQEWLIIECRLQTYFVMRFSCNLLPRIGLQIVSMYLLKRDNSHCKSECLVQWLRPIWLVYKMKLWHKLQWIFS